MSESNGVLSPTEIELRIQELKVQESVLANRLAWNYAHNVAFGGKRDYGEVLGYTKALMPEHYHGRFERQGIAHRAVTIYPNETWRIPPKVWEDETEIDTPFEQAVKEMEQRLRVNRQFYRADILACLNRFSILFIGFNDATTLAALEREVSAADGRRVEYLSPFSERHVRIVEFEERIRSPRFSLPLIYEIDFNRGAHQVDRDVNRARPNKGFDLQRVHWSRVIHLADGLVEDDIYGTPKLRPVFDLLDDLMKVVGGGAEMFWRSARKDLITEINSDATFSKTDLDAIKNEIDDYIHDINKSLILGNATAKSLAPGVASPKEHVEVIVALMASALSVPQRKIWGSERGELASSQDENNFYAEVQSRQNDRATSWLRDWYDRCITYRVLPEPAGGPDAYTVEWEPLIVENENEKADVTLKLAQAWDTITRGVTLGIVPLQEVREALFKWDPESPYELDDVLDAVASAGDDDTVPEDEADVPEDDEGDDEGDDEE